MTVVDPLALRNAFGSFMTGVTVVTARTSNGAPLGFTANSFSSVSLEPPLLLVCPGKFLSSFGSFRTCKHFAVNVLAEGQEEVSNTFASFNGDRFARVGHSADLHGIPVIDGAIARFSCTTHQAIEAGDHCILIGEVQDFAHLEGQGLGYVGGQYFSLGLERAALDGVTGKIVCGAIIERIDHVLLEKTPEGFRPPQIDRFDHGQLRRDLCDHLASRGLVIDLGSAYSVFDDQQSQTHHAYYLATNSAASTNDDLIAVPINDLTSLSYANPAIADMMARFATESRTRSFSLYIGDTQHGDVHALPERT